MKGLTGSVDGQMYVATDDFADYSVPPHAALLRGDDSLMLFHAPKGGPVTSGQGHRHCSPPPLECPKCRQLWLNTQLQPFTSVDLSHPMNAGVLFLLMCFKALKVTVISQTNWNSKIFFVGGKAVIIRCFGLSVSMKKHLKTLV